MDRSPRFVSTRRGSAVWRSALGVAMAAVACGATLPATAAASSPEEPQHGGEFVALMNGLNWPSIDPLYNTATTGILASIYGQLFAPGPEATIVPQLATDYEIAEDGLSVDIFLREGVVFHDGTEFNAEAVVFSWNRYLDPANACTCLPDLRYVDSVEAVDAHTARMNLTEPYAPIIASFLGKSHNYIVSPTALEDMGPEEFGQNGVGAGPFKVVSNRASAETVLERNPDYWDGDKPYLDGLRFIQTSADQSNVQAIQSGQANLAWVQNVPLIEAAMDNPDLDVHMMPAATPRMVLLNGTRPPFDDIRARQAVTYATDPAGLNSALYSDLFDLVQGFTGPGLMFYQPEVATYEGYDPERARELVEELGGLQVELIAKNNTPSYQLETEAIAAQWNSLGIETSVLVSTIPQSNERFASGDWQAFDSMYGSQPDPAIALCFIFCSDGGNVGTPDEDLDTILAEASSTFDEDARAELYEQAQELIAERYLFIPLYATPVIFVSSPDVRGLTPTASVVGFEQYGDIWLDR